MEKTEIKMNRGQGSSKKFGAIALTGSGYKGLALLRWLEKDPKFPHVVYINYKKPSIPIKKARFYRIDLTETLVDAHLAKIFKKEKIDTLVHTAFPITPPHNMAWAHELISVGSMYICNAAAEARVRKLILPSTSDVYGAFPNNPNYLTEAHSARAGLKSKILADKIDAENLFLKFQKKYPESVVTILRPATILGPTIRSYKTAYLGRWVVPTVLGFDPMVQFTHEEDMLRAFQMVIEKDFPGIFNIASRGVIPLSKAIQLMGKINLPLTLVGLKTLVQLLWYLNISPAPGDFLDYLKYTFCVATDKAGKIMGFKPKYNCKQTLIDFVGAQRLREVNLIKEAEVSR